jgi:hypothetical protein
MTTAKSEQFITADRHHNPSGSTDRLEDRYDQLVDHLSKNGYLTDKQIEYARRVQAKLETARPLLQVIKELKFIADDRIKEAVRKYPVSMGIVTSAHLTWKRPCISRFQGGPNENSVKYWSTVHWWMSVSWQKPLPCNWESLFSSPNGRTWIANCSPGCR